MTQTLRRMYMAYFLTPNSLRYRIEYRCIQSCLKRVEHVGRALDAGAGSGEMSRKLLASGKITELHAIEADQGNYRKLVRNLEDYENAFALQGSILDLPFDSSWFDLVMSTQVLEHIEDHEKAVAELERVLKPEGFLLISVPHPPELLKNPEHVRPGYTEDELVQLCQKFELSHIHTEYFLSLPTWRRNVAATELKPFMPLIPIYWVDQDAGKSQSWIRDNQPYGMCCLFTKGAQG